MTYSLDEFNFQRQDSPREGAACIGSTTKATLTTTFFKRNHHGASWLVEALLRA